MDIWDKRRRNLAAWMAAHGHNGAQVARDADLSVNTVNKFLKGENHTLRWSTLEKICEVVGINNIAVLDSDNPFSGPKNKLYALIEAMTEEEAEKELARLTSGKKTK